MNPAIDSLVRAMVSNWPPVTRWQWTVCALRSACEPHVSWRGRWNAIGTLVSVLRRWDDAEPHVRRMVALAGLARGSK